MFQTLIASHLHLFPCWIRWNPDTERHDKGPSVPKGVSWKDFYAQPEHWPGVTVAGIMMPPGVVVIDRDDYKPEFSFEKMNELLGDVPWGLAHIQNTISGGAHYAFRAPAGWNVRQDSNVGGTGIDTRVDGKGFICTGQGYTPIGMGCIRLAYPESLPVLPDSCRQALEHVSKPPAQHQPHEHTDTATSDIIAALKHVDPGCVRSEWVRVGLALRSHFKDDDASGMLLFDDWSMGIYWSDGCPENYVPEVIEHQWYSFKPEGNTNIATLFYKAVEGGWLPPSTVDSSLAFGADAAPTETFSAMVDNIEAHGSDPKQYDGLMAQIASGGFNKRQHDILLATLMRAVKEAGLLTKSLSAELNPAAKTLQVGVYGKNHTENAKQFRELCYPNNTLTRSDQVWYVYTGKAWEEASDEDIRCKVAVAMADSFPQASNITGTYTVLAALCHTPGQRINEMPDHLTLFQNGVLDLRSGFLAPHDPVHFTTNILPYEYNPDALAPRWMQFLDEVFEEDAERIALLQEWFGYMLTSSYAHHKMLFMLGPPRSGKSTIGQVLEQIVGPQNYTGASLHSFASDSFLDSLQTKTVAFSGDTERHVNRGNLDRVIERIKRVSGHDPVEFDRKYKSQLSRTLPTRIIIAGNTLPALFDDSGALAGRMLLLLFNVSQGDNGDKQLIGKLLAELEGIGLWALQGMARLRQSEQFTIPASSRDEVKHIAETYSPLTVFLDEACEVTQNPAHIVTCDTLYATYKAWAIAEQEARVLSRRGFISTFKDMTRGLGCRYGTHRIDKGPPVRGFKGLVLLAVSSAATSPFKPEVVA